MLSKKVHTAAGVRQPLQSDHFREIYHSLITLYFRRSIYICDDDDDGC